MGVGRAIAVGVGGRTIAVGVGGKMTGVGVGGNTIAVGVGGNVTGVAVGSGSGSVTGVAVGSGSGKVTGVAVGRGSGSSASNWAIAFAIRRSTSASVNPVEQPTMAIAAPNVSNIFFKIIVHSLLKYTAARCQNARLQYDQVISSTNFTRKDEY